MKGLRQGAIVAVGFSGGGGQFLWWWSWVFKGGGHRFGGGGSWCQNFGGVGTKESTKLKNTT